MFQYIQSRFYRSPEVLLGIKYDLLLICGAWAVYWWRTPGSLCSAGRMRYRRVLFANVIILCSLGGSDVQVVEVLGVPPLSYVT